MSYQIHSQNILVVDDEPMIQKALKMILIQQGHTIELAGDGPEALQRFAQQKFDVVFTDLNMPEMRGDELARRMRRENPYQVIVMISAYADLLTPRQRKETPVDLYVNKPFQLRTILDALQRAHEINKVHKKNAEQIERAVQLWRC